MHPSIKNRTKLFLILILLTIMLITAISVPQILSADEGPITKLKFKNTTDPDKKPDCGDGWKRYHQNLNAGGLATGDTWSTEPAVYLCYKTGDAADAITHLYPISQTDDLGKGSCYGDDKLVENEKGTWTNINREGWKVQKDRLCYGKDGDYPLLDFTIKTTVGVPEDFEYRQPNVNPKTGDGGTGQTFNFGGTLLYLFTQDRSTVAHDYDCGGEGENPCLITTEFWWTNGNGACDRGLREKDGKCKNGRWPFQRHHDEVEDFQNGTDDGDWILWALNNQRTNLAIDEPLNWVMNFQTHNAFNNHADGYVIDPNHRYSITDQLDLGSRVLMLDVHDYNDEVRLCHGLDDGAGCVLDDRLYFNAIKELGNWLDDNPGEFVQVRFEEYLKSDDAETINFPIDEYIGASRVYRHEDYVSVLTECLNGSKTCTAADAHRWPSLAELRKAGKQAMFLGSNDFGDEFFTSRPANYGGTANGFFGGEGETDEYSVVPDGDDPNYEVNCMDTAVWANDDLTTTAVSEDRTVIGLFVDDWPGILNADRVETLARCNLSINFDFINSQWATDNDQIESPCIHAARNGLADACIYPDNRMEAAVWSWRKGDMGDNGAHAKLANSDKRWVSTDQKNEHHFACAKKRDKDDLTSLTDSSGSEWYVTETIGPWEDGASACTEEFGTSFVFSVPVNGWQNEKLKEALQDAKDSNGYDESSDDVWLNYRRGSKDGEHFWVKGRSLDFAQITAVTPALEGQLGIFFNSGRTFGFSGNGIYWLDHKWELKNLSNNTTIELAQYAGFLPAFHIFEDSGNYEIILTIKDLAGQTGVTRSLFTVGNFKPTAAFSGSASVLEGSDATAQFTDPFDLSPADEAAGFTYSYDFKDDGIFKPEPGFSQLISPTVTIPGQYLHDKDRSGTDPVYRTISARIYDKDGDSTQYKWPIEVINVDPTATFSGTVTTTTPVQTIVSTVGSLNIGRMLKSPANSGESHFAASPVTFDEGSSVPLFSNPVDSAGDLVEGMRVLYYGNLRGQQVTGNPDPGLTGTISYDCSSYTNPDPSLRPGFVQYANGTPFDQSSCRFVDGPLEQSVSAWLIDKDEGYTEYNGTVTVRNVAPTVQTPVASPASPDEGSTVSASAVFTDPGVLDAPFTCTVNYGDGSGDKTGTVSITESLLRITATCTGPDHVYADNGSYTATVTIADKDHSASVNGQGSSSTLITVNNVDPVLSLNGDTIDENGTATVSGTITDPGTLDTFDVEIDWGEGPKMTYSYGAGTTSFTVSHQYLDDNPGGTPSDIYTIKGDISDDDGGTGSASSTVSVNNVNPVANIVSIGDETGTAVGSGVRVSLVHTEIDLSAGFSDVGSQDTHTAGIDWDDGIQINLGSTTSPIAASHTFADTGTYVIQLNVTDDDTGVGLTTASIMVVDASGAISAAVDDLKILAADPGLDPAAIAALREALVQLEGDNDGAGSNGALDMFAKGNLNAALVKIRDAVIFLEAAESADPSLDLTSVKSLLVLAAKSAALTAILEADAAASKRSEIRKVEEAYALIDDADGLLAALNYVDAAESYRKAARAVAGILN